jgi:hypothetical protein
VTSYLGLTDRNMQGRICLKVILKFGGREILVSTTSFLKKYYRLTSTASDRKGAKIQYDIS